MKSFSAFIQFFLLVSVFTFTLSIEQVEASNTIYIRADGSIDPVTANITSVDNVTYIFTGNNYDSLVVERDNIVVDGAGYTLQGSESGSGFNLTSVTNVTIRNTNTENFKYAINLDSSSNNTISSNIISRNVIGLYLEASHNNTIRSNILSNNTPGWYCIGLRFSNDNTIIGNILSNNRGGLYLDNSGGNTLENNTMINNELSFGVTGRFDNNVDISNTVNDKPIYYLKNQKDLIINSLTFPIIGYLGIINSINVTVENLSLTGNYQGILFASTNDSVMKNVNTSHNWSGIALSGSDNNTISSNTLTHNDWGILLYGSCYNLVMGNNVTYNKSGIELGSACMHNIVEANTLFNDECNISLHGSSNNIYHNNFIKNFTQVRSYMSSNMWDNGYPCGGNYWSNYAGVDVKSGAGQDLPGSDCLGDTPWFLLSDTDHYPLMNPYTWVPHDIRITSVTTSKTIVGQGCILDSNITVLNYGIYTENFNLTTYANTTIIATFDNITLTSGTSTIITFTWNTTNFAKGDYILSVQVTPIPGEAFIVDNTYNYGICVTIPGDIDGDRDVDIYDIVLIAGCYGSNEGDPKYIANCDIDGDGDVDIFDIVMACGHYEQSW